MHCRQGRREAVYATSVIFYTLDFDASAHIKRYANYHLRINQNRTLTMLLSTLPLRFSDPFFWPQDELQPNLTDCST
jgi:hypothetical protein